MVYGEFRTGDQARSAKDKIKALSTDFELVGRGRSTRSYGPSPTSSRGCVIKTVEGIRLKKKYFWDQAKVINRHWLAANMNGEAFLGFNAFNNKKTTGRDTIDFIEFRRRQIKGKAFDDEFMEAVLAKPRP